MGCGTWQKQAARGTVWTVLLCLVAWEWLHATSVFVTRYRSTANLDAHREAQAAHRSCVDNTHEMLATGFKRVCDDHRAWWPTGVPLDSPYVRQVMWQTWKEEWEHLGELWSWLHPSGTFYAWCAVGFLYLNQHWALVAPVVLALLSALVGLFWRQVILPCLDARQAHQLEKLVHHQRAKSNWLQSQQQPLYPSLPPAPPHARTMSMPDVLPSQTMSPLPPPTGFPDFWADVPLGPPPEKHIELRDPSLVVPLPPPATRTQHQRSFSKFD
jgi:hypothetical protein